MREKTLKYVLQRECFKPLFYFNRKQMLPQGSGSVAYSLTPKCLPLASVFSRLNPAPHRTLQKPTEVGGREGEKVDKLAGRGPRQGSVCSLPAISQGRQTPTDCFEPALPPKHN